MYEDPKNIKENRCNSRYDDYEFERLMHWANATGFQKASFQRRATLKLIEELEAEFNSHLTGKEVAS